jgi:hypothetical protein
VKIGSLEFARGLMLLGLFGLAVSAVLLALDWAAFEDRSNTETLALCGSVALLVLGGWLERSPGAALQHALAGVFLAGVFVALACLIDRHRNPHFFPRRSLILLELAGLAGGLAALGLYLMNRFTADGAPRAWRGPL